MNQFTASLWGDEAFTALLAQKSLPQIISVVARDTAPPGHYFALHLWMKLFGTSELAIRSLSFTLYFLAALGVFLIARHLFNKKTALLAALLTFFNPFLFAYAFEGRMYAIMAFGVVYSMYFFLKKNWPAYVIATLIALYSHHFAIFAVIAQSLILTKQFLSSSAKPWPGFKAQLAVALGYLPWLYPLYRQTQLVGTGFWLATPTLNNLTQLIKSFLIINSWPQWLATLTWIAFFTILLFRRWHKKFSSSLFLLAWFLTPILLTFLISQIYTSIFFDRYLLYVIPGLALLLSSQTRKFSLIPLLFLIALWAWQATLYFTHPTKRPFKQLATYVQSTRQPTDTLINWNAAAHHLWESKYYQIPAPIYLPDDPLPYYTGTAQMTPQDTIKTLPQSPRIGVITSEPPDKIHLPGYTKDEVKTFPSLTFIWFTQTVE